MSYCLIKPLADKFKQAIKNGDIDIDKLSEMTSEERRIYFTENLGERNAKEINALFESKLLLKNQRLGMVNWAKQITGIKPEVKNTLIDKIMKMDKILSPDNSKAFLEDLVAKRLGVDVSVEEAKNISQLSNKIKELEAVTDTTKSDIPLGRAKMALTDYINELNSTKADLITNVANVPRSLMASLDLSAPLNQGWGMLSRKNFYKSVKSMLSYAKDEEAFKNLQAEILTSPVYKNATKAGLRITNLGQKLEQREEQFMTTILDKIPGIRGSERAYVGFLNKLRMDEYSRILKNMELAGEDVGVGSQATKDLANMVNNFTGGARVGKIEGATPFLNSLFFSPRKIKSTLEIMNPLNYTSSKISPIVRKEATRNLIGSLAMTAGALTLANIAGVGKAETNPTSSDYGKLVTGNTHLDFSGGNSGYFILLSRLKTGKTKSTNTGKISDLGNKFGQTSKFKSIADFLRNKLSPNASLLVDSIVGANSIGEEKTIPQSVIDRFKPMFLNNLAEIIKDDKTGATEKAVISVLSLFGANSSVYQKTTSSRLKPSNPFKK